MHTLNSLTRWSVVLCLLAACGDGEESDDANADTRAPATFAEQAALGQSLYKENCAMCHGDSGQGSANAPRVVGLDEGALPLDPPASRKVRDEKFVTVGDVASFVVMNMPPGKAGSLSTEQYLAVLAFDLKANGINLDQKLDLDLAETLTIPR
jgi:S-disulfanyl-L-cysteine oxidoreductase SoxD